MPARNGSLTPCAPGRGEESSWKTWCWFAITHLLAIQDVLTGTTLLRLAPYLPALNPIETVWSALKACVQRELRVPQVQGLGVGEQRLSYLEEVVQNSLNQLNDQICVRAVQHSTTFHADVMALNDLRVGQ